MTRAHFLSVASILAACAAGSNLGDGTSSAGGATGPSGSGGATASASTSGDASSSEASSSDAGSTTGGGGTSASGSAVSTSATSASSVAASSATSVTASSTSAASTGSGGGSGDPWFEIKYTQSSTPTSPTWKFSSTPGYTAADWAYQGKNWPEVWDVYNSIQVKFDPMGAYAAIVDSGDTLQVMLGFGKLSSYQDIQVELEGRGYSSSSSGKFDVYNPLNNCGVSVTMAHDWSLHLAKVSLGKCILTGNKTQAIRVKPTQNGVALSRMKVTIVGAVY